MGKLVPDYCLIGPHSFGNPYDQKTLEPGTFVKPIQRKYLPQHILEDERWRWVDHDITVFCYCSAGIIPIPRDLIRSI